MGTDNDTNVSSLDEVNDDQIDSSSTSDNDDDDIDDVNDNDDVESIIQVSFSNYVDLQSRLQLIPTDDNLGLGASVVNFVPNNDDEEHLVLEGCVLKRILFHDDNGDVKEEKEEDNMKDLSSVEFADILGVIRGKLLQSTDDDDDDDVGTSQKVTLVFHKGNLVIEEEEDNDDDSSSVESRSNTKDFLKEATQSLSLWGNQLAQKAGEVRNQASKRIKEQQMQHARKKQVEKVSVEGISVYELYLKDGSEIGYHPLTETSSDVTNMSVLQVRKTNGTDDLKDLRYQWQKCSSSSIDEQKWTNIQGSIYSTFQPCALDVNCSVRCMIRHKEQPTFSNTYGPLTIDKMLLAAARNSLSVGSAARFCGLEGKGNATGRTLSISINKEGNCSPPVVTFYEHTGNKLVRNYKSNAFYP